MAGRYTFGDLFSRSAQFDPDDDQLNTAFVDKFMPLLEALSLWFRPSYHGIEKIPPQGGALLVGNHGILGFDAFFVFVAIYQATGRLPRGLGDHHLFIEPLTRKFWQAVGAVDGHPEVGLKFLRAGQLVNVYPGGAREALKSPHERYRLKWGHSYGFVRLALRAQVPVILHMCIGNDDTYRVLGRLPFSGLFMGHRKYELPLWLGWGPLPRPVKLDYYFSDPIQLEGEPKDADDQALVERNHQRLWQLGHKMLDQGLSRRKSLWFG